MPGKTLMIQGTASHVGKSVLTAAICRILHEDGWRVAPFKAQNMALNSYVTPEGGEIGRAQAMQASACRIEPHVDMNPILMKPNHDTEAQIIFRGRPVKNMSVAEYAAFKKEIFPRVLESLQRLKQDYGIVVIEGAGSPAEINLKEQDIVNMKIAAEAAAPVVLVGDIDRGGVFASFVGTMELLDPVERDNIAAFLINKFRGDASLLTSGIDYLKQRTGKPALGVIPFWKRLNLPEEDSLSKKTFDRDSEKSIRVRVILLPHLSNFTDFDAFQQEPDVALRYASSVADCESADLIILPGSKSTIADLGYLRDAGFVEFLSKKPQETTLLGICAGFQMLGRKIFDPLKVESLTEEADGIGLVPSSTVFQQEKETRQVSGDLFETSLPMRGYEIHHGSVRFESSYTPFFLIRDGRSPVRSEGYSDPARNIYGSSIHGIFDQPEFRRWFLNRIRKKKGWEPLNVLSIDPDLAYQELAAMVRKNIDMDLLYRIIEKKI
ncbi:cobyric acid synthase [bacterium]|nr:cobyric acid synthase [bacterium]